MLEIFGIQFREWQGRYELFSRQRRSYQEPWSYYSVYKSGSDWKLWCSSQFPVSPKEQQLICQELKESSQMLFLKQVEEVVDQYMIRLSNLSLFI